MLIMGNKYLFLKDGAPTKIHAPVIGKSDLFRHAISFHDITFWDSKEEIEGFASRLVGGLPPGIEIAQMGFVIAPI